MVTPKERVYFGEFIIDGCGFFRFVGIEGQVFINKHAKVTGFRKVLDGFDGLWKEGRILKYLLVLLHTFFGLGGVNNGGSGFFEVGNVEVIGAD